MRKLVVTLLFLLLSSFVYTSGDISVLIDQGKSILLPSKEGVRVEIKETNVEGNREINSFKKSKAILEKIYIGEDRVDFYCGCTYNSNKEINLSTCGFINNGKYEKRSKKIEWEHVVPAHAFGQSFVEWREGHTSCIDSKGKLFKGRSCAEKVNEEYRFMQADIYNLLPVNGSINAQRSNYSITQFSNKQNIFGKCSTKIFDRKFEPRDKVKGDVARIYLYMNLTYPSHGIVSEKNKKLIEAWDKIDPVDENECKIYLLKKSYQNNDNVILKERCNL